MKDSLIEGGHLDGDQQHPLQRLDSRRRMFLACRHGPYAQVFYLARICNHCTYSACLASCPRGSIYKRPEDGIVLVDQGRCRGYQECVKACPYKKVFYNPMTGTSEKCIACFPKFEPGSPEQVAMAKRYAPARALENPMAGRRDQPVEDLIAEGPGTLRPAAETRSTGRGARGPSGWTVALARPLPAGLGPGTRSQLAVAVWEGAHGEAGARKMRSVWIPITVEGKKTEFLTCHLAAIAEPFAQRVAEIGPTYLVETARALAERVPTPPRPAAGLPRCTHPPRLLQPMP